MRVSQPRLLSLILAASLSATLGWAQGISEEPQTIVLSGAITSNQIQSQGFGTQDEFIYNLNPSDFETIALATVASLLSADFWIEPADAGFVEIVAPIHMPSGTKVISMTTYYFDDEPTTNPEKGWFVRSPNNGAGAVAVETLFTGTTPGWTSATGAVNWDIENQQWHYSYRIRLNRNAAGERHRLARVAIRYKLQISDPPATPTFADVPSSHPFYQFIEALAASGITAGCTGPPNPNYCPNDFLTRGQMAVFLARALGLHWAP